MVKRISYIFRKYDKRALCKNYAKHFEGIEWMAEKLN